MLCRRQGGQIYIFFISSAYIIQVYLCESSYNLRSFWDFIKKIVHSQVFLFLHVEILYKLSNIVLSSCILLYDICECNYFRYSWNVGHAWFLQFLQLNFLDKVQSLKLFCVFWSIMLVDFLRWFYFLQRNISIDKFYYCLIFQLCCDTLCLVQCFGCRFGVRMLLNNFVIIFKIYNFLLFKQSCK